VLTAALVPVARAMARLEWTARRPRPWPRTAWATPAAVLVVAVAAGAIAVLVVGGVVAAGPAALAAPAAAVAPHPHRGRVQPVPGVALRHRLAARAGGQVRGLARRTRTCPPVRAVAPAPPATGGRPGTGS